MLMTVACFFTEKMNEAEEKDKVSCSSLIERLFPIGTHSVSLAHLRLRLIFVEVEEKNQAEKMCT